MAKSFFTGTLSTETNYGKAVRIAMHSGFTSAIADGRTNWSIVDHSFTNGTFERTVFNCNSGNGFSIMVGNHNAAGTHTFNSYIGRRYFSVATRTITSITAASTTGTTPNFSFVYTTSSTHDIKVGEVVSITGLTDANYNRTNSIVTAVTSNTFTVFTGTLTRAAISGQSGTVTVAGSMPVTDASGNGTTVTYTFTPTNNFLFRVGDVIAVSGMNPSAYNLTGTVTAVTPTTVSIASTVTGTFVSGGAVGFSTIGFEKSLHNIGFANASTNYTAASDGYSTGYLNPTAVNTIVSPHNAGNTVTVATTASTWFIVVDDDYAVFALKDGSTGVGVVWYFGAFESAVTNTSLTEIAPFGLFQNGTSGTSIGRVSIFLHSLGNGGKNIQHGALAQTIQLNEIGRPAAATIYDGYKAGTKSVVSRIKYYRGEQENLTSAVNPNTDGHLRALLKGVVYASPVSAAFGDQIDIDGTTYVYGGGTSNVAQSVGSNPMAWWVAIN